MSKQVLEKWSFRQIHNLRRHALRALVPTDELHVEHNPERLRPLHHYIAIQQYEVDHEPHWTGPVFEERQREDLVSGLGGAEGSMQRL